MKRLAASLTVVLAVTAWVAAQQPDPAVENLARTYEAAFNKGDAKAIAALHTADAVRMFPDGQVVTGRTGIEEAYAAALAAELKGAKLTIGAGQTQKLTADVITTTGTYEVVGGKTPAKGRYLNTLKREGGQWLLATVATADLASGTK
jgi:uncharacterized protein (TIGR02246 family)